MEMNRFVAEQVELFKGLTRDGMYERLKQTDVAAARGKSRATKEVLIEAYQTALLILTPPQGTVADESFPAERPMIVVQDSPVSGELGMMALLASSLQAPVLVETVSGEPAFPAELDHASLELRMAAEVARVNPEMPEAPALATPPSTPSELSGPLSYRFLEGDQARDFSPREEAAWRRFVGGMKEFRANPANSRARKWAQGAAVDLKVLGVEVNPSHLLELKTGAKVVRDHRRMQALAG